MTTRKVAPPPSVLESVIARLSTSTPSSLSSSLATSSRRDLPDEDFDRYVADLILREAHDRSVNGASSSSSSSSERRHGWDNPEAAQSRAASTNKRFLASVIRNVDGHNKTVGGRLPGRIKEDDEGDEVDEGKGQRHRRDGASSNLKRAEKSKAPSSPSAASSRNGALSSKMDRYFAPSYDAALDINLEDSTDPKTGLIADGGWDRLRDLDRTDDKKRKKRDGDRLSESDNEAEEGREKRRHRSSRSHRRHSTRTDDDSTSSRLHRSRHSKSRKSTRRDRSYSGSPSGSRSRSRFRSPTRRDSDRHRHRHHERRRREEDDEDDDGDSRTSRRSKRSRRSTSPSTVNLSTRLGRDALDTVYSSRGQMREWDLGKQRE